MCLDTSNKNQLLQGIQRDRSCRHTVQLDQHLADLPDEQTPRHILRQIQMLPWQPINLTWQRFFILQPTSSASTILFFSQPAAKLQPQQLQDLLMSNLHLWQPTELEYHSSILTLASLGDHSSLHCIGLSILILNSHSLFCN